MTPSTTEPRKYYTTEKSDSAASRRWEPCNAKTLAQAKRIASRRQSFHGTVVAVGVKLNEEMEGGIEQAAVRREGHWIDYI